MVPTQIVLRKRVDCPVKAKPAAVPKKHWSLNSDNRTSIWVPRRNALRQQISHAGLRVWSGRRVHSHPPARTERAERSGPLVAFLGRRTVPTVTGYLNVT